jgi:DNA-binding IclR family transcriptional regulator
MAVKQIKSIQRCLQILSAFRDVQDPKLDAYEISQLTNIPTSSLYRYLQTLTKQLVLDYDANLNKFTLGPLILSLGTIAYKHNDLASLARPIMRELCDELKESVFLTAVRGYDAVCVERIEWQHSIQLILNPGDTFPLHLAATGKILMAYLPVEKQEEIISRGLKRFTKYTLTDPNQLRESLEEIRENGFAFSNQEHNPGAMAISAPVFDSSDQIAAGLSIAAPIDRFLEKDLTSRKDLIIAYANKLSASLGHNVARSEFLKKQKAEMF